ncbi:hypothetical protein M885DRAFT_558915 [Pelagophyceae sp. CCMP2097]|nr:hypothetical protein M885DRAFT_558915 [Pelagophyceae sp. CCMP2097]
MEPLGEKLEALKISEKDPKLLVILQAVVDLEIWCESKTLEGRRTLEKTAIGEVPSAVCYDAGQTAYLSLDIEGKWRFPLDEKEAKDAVRMKCHFFFALKGVSALAREKGGANTAERSKLIEAARAVAVPGAAFITIIREGASGTVP